MKTSINSRTHDLREIAFRQFGDYPARFRQYLSEQNYGQPTIVRFLRCVGILATVMEKKRISVRDLDETLAIELFRKGRSWNKKDMTNAFHMVRCFIRFLREHGLGKPPLPPTAKEIARAELELNYKTYLRRQRGLRESTIRRNWLCASYFLDFRFGKRAEDLSKIGPADITNFLLQMATRKRPLRDKQHPSHMRNFLRYLFNAGKTQSDLSVVVPKVKTRHGKRLPRHLTSQQVETLLEAVRCETPVSRRRRNYAMILLLARLGLRAQEVVAIQVDDIDWRAGEVIVRGKGSKHDRLPLPPDVGQAIADYIRLDRVTTSRTLFVTDTAPHRPFTDGQVMQRILKDAFARTGLKPPLPYGGSHVLRHSLATNMVRQGASIEEIGDMLRHSSLGTTMLYARLDEDGLRAVSQSWPIAGGAK